MLKKRLVKADKVIDFQSYVKPDQNQNQDQTQPETDFNKLDLEKGWNLLDYSEKFKNKTRANEINQQADESDVSGTEMLEQLQKFYEDINRQYIKMTSIDHFDPPVNGIISVTNKAVEGFIDTMGLYVNILGQVLNISEKIIIDNDVTATEAQKIKKALPFFTEISERLRKHALITIKCIEDGKINNKSIKPDKLTACNTYKLSAAMMDRITKFMNNEFSSYFSAIVK